MAEKLQLATEESYRDPANIQSKHQKHQAFEAELAANADRIQVLQLNEQPKKMRTNIDVYKFRLCLLWVKI